MANVVVELLHCLCQTLGLQSFFNLYAKANFSITTCIGMHMQRQNESSGWFDCVEMSLYIIKLTSRVGSVVTKV